MYPDSQVIEAFSKIPADSPLPREGPCSLFYVHFTDRENSILLSSESSHHIFYFNSYDTIEAVTDEPPGLFFERKGNTLLLLAIFNPGGDYITCYLPFNTADDKHSDLLHHLIKNGTAGFHFITLLYGELHKMRSIELTFPRTAIAELERNWE